MKRENRAIGQAVAKKLKPAFLVIEPGNLSWSPRISSLFQGLSSAKFKRLALLRGRIFETDRPNCYPLRTQVTTLCQNFKLFICLKKSGRKNDLWQIPACQLRIILLINKLSLVILVTMDSRWS